MHPFTLAFLVALSAIFGIRIWLLQRQYRAVGDNGDTAADARRPDAVAYARDQLRFRQVDTGVETLLLLGWTIFGGIAALDTLWRNLDLPSVATGTGVIASVIAVSALVDLPLRIWRVFRIEQRHGFNRTGPALFLADQARTAALALLLGLPLVALVLWLMTAGGGLWWLWVWLVWLALNAVMLWLGPRLIAPLFNRYRPLRDPALRERLETLVRRCGFRTDGIYVVDGSRRSRHANAYFTGVGRSRRIVLYDTLLEQLGTSQLDAVLAHELGHFRHGHIRRMAAISALASLAGLLLLAWLLDQPWFYAGLGVDRPSLHTGLLLFLLTVPLVTFVLKPVAAGLSRRHEFEADAFAARHCPPENLISALTVLYRENAAGLPSDPLYSLFHDSHPPARPRIARLERLRGQPPAMQQPSPSAV